MLRLSLLIDQTYLVVVLALSRLSVCTEPAPPYYGQPQAAPAPAPAVQQSVS